MFQARRLLVTGHLGFLGSAFCWKYRDRYELIGLDFAGWGSMEENRVPGMAEERADLADAGRVESILERSRPDAVVNFAAESHVDRSTRDDLGFWRSNVLGARNLARAALRHRLRLVHVSTDEVYGDAGDATDAWTEASPLEPGNPYSVTKAAADMMLGVYNNVHDLDVVITRGANTIGPRQFPEKAVPKAISCFLAGTPFPLYRTPARRMWMHVEDHVAGVEAALLRGGGGEVYNLAPHRESEAYTHEVIRRVREIVGQGEIREVEDRKAYDLRYWMSASKARRKLEWRPRHDLAGTIESTVRWYLENPDWLRAASEKLSAGADGLREPL